MSTETDEDEMVDVEMDGGMKPPQQTIFLEVPVNEFEASKKDLLEDAGVDVKSNLAAQLQPHVENLLHELYQQGRYQQR